MENSKLSFASPYSYSLFQGGSPTELQGLVLLPGMDKQSTQQWAPGSCPSQVISSCKMTSGDKEMVAPSSGNLVNTPVQIFFPPLFLRNAVADCKSWVKEMPPLGKVLSYWKIAISLKPLGWAGDDTQEGWTYHSWWCQQTKPQIRKARTTPIDHIINAAILHNSYYKAH